MGQRVLPPGSGDSPTRAVRGGPSLKLFEITPVFVGTVPSALQVCAEACVDVGRCAMDVYSLLSPLVRLRVRPVLSLQSSKSRDVKEYFRLLIRLALWLHQLVFRAQVA